MERCRYKVRALNVIFIWFLPLRMEFEGNNGRVSDASSILGRSVCESFSPFTFFFYWFVARKYSFLSSTSFFFLPFIRIYKFSMWTVPSPYNSTVVNVEQLRERVISESKVLSLAGHNFDFFGNSLFEIPLFFETDNWKGVLFEVLLKLCFSSSFAIFFACNSERIRTLHQVMFGRLFLRAFLIRQSKCSVFLFSNFALVALASLFLIKWKIRHQVA